TSDEVTVTDAALRKIAADYTREPGVRQFERLLAKALRKAATNLGTEAGTADDVTSLVIDAPDLVDYLGRPRFTPESFERTAVPG
ncbi:endopeptidase La, partial [Mycobacterium sp. ITM-2017-0098]